MRSKNTDAAHNGPIPVGSTAWVNFQTDITAMFDQASLYGNKYMMVIIDTKSKNLELETLSNALAVHVNGQGLINPHS